MLALVIVLAKILALVTQLGARAVLSTTLPKNLLELSMHPEPSFAAVTLPSAILLVSTHRSARKPVATPKSLRATSSLIIPIPRPVLTRIFLPDASRPSVADTSLIVAISEYETADVPRVVISPLSTYPRPPYEVPCSTKVAPLRISLLPAKEEASALLSSEYAVLLSPTLVTV